MEEKEYPFWSISAKWNDKKYPNNGASFTVSFRKDFNDEYMNQWAKKWWDKYVAKKYPDETPELLELNVKFLGKSVWFGTWFSHRSLNRFETEKEAFESFNRYMDSLKKKPGTGDWDSLFIDKNGYEYCVMGAEDSWRWKYCDCKVCKRLKQTIIKH